MGNKILSNQAENMQEVDQEANSESHLNDQNSDLNKVRI